MDIVRNTTPAIAAAQQVTAQMHAHAGRPVLLLLSGGSWFAALDQVADTSWLNPTVTIGMLDERFSVDSAVNNFTQLMATKFYVQALASGVTSIDSRVQSDESHSRYAARLAAAWQHWRQAHPSGVVIVTLGMGTDGHTAGLFPNSLALASTDWVVADNVSADMNPCVQRATATAHFLQTEVTAAFVLITGERKCSVLHKVLKNTASVETLPACLWHTMSTVTVVTDCSESC